MGVLVFLRGAHSLSTAMVRALWACLYNGHCVELPLMRVCACVTPRSASSVNAQDWEWESDTFGSDSSCPVDATAAVFTALTVVLYIIGCWGWILQVCAQCILLHTQRNTHPVTQ